MGPGWTRMKVSCDHVLDQQRLTSLCQRFGQTLRQGFIDVHKAAYNTDSSRHTIHVD